MKNSVAAFICLILLFCSFNNFIVKSKKYKIKTVVIDPGHGGRDPGCSGKTAKESEMTLKIALELGKLIKQNLRGVKVIYTREKNVFVELHDRAEVANKNNADLFISIHCNSGPKNIKGTETYTMGLHSSEGNLDVAKRENSVILKEENYKKYYDGFDPYSPQAHILFSLYQNAYIENSLRFADKVEEQFRKKLGRVSRGVKQAGFIVLWKTAMPSALIEIGYLTNKEEEAYLNKKSNQTNIASGIYRAFKQYKEDMESTD